MLQIIIPSEKKLIKRNMILPTDRAVRTLVLVREKNKRPQYEKCSL